MGSDITDRPVFILYGGLIKNGRLIMKIRIVV